MDDAFELVTPARRESAIFASERAADEVHLTAMPHGFGVELCADDEAR